MYQYQLYHHLANTHTSSTTVFFQQKKFPHYIVTYFVCLYSAHLLYLFVQIMLTKMMYFYGIDTEQYAIL